MTALRLHAALGIVVLLAIGALCSSDRRAIRPRVIVPALGLQIAIGLAILVLPAGRVALHALATFIDRVIGFGMVGTGFVFGDLVGPRMAQLFPGGGFIFALRVLPQIVYISALIAVLYHYGIMQRLARTASYVIRKVTGTTALESFSAVIAVFLGQTEVPIAIRPYLASLDRTELFSAMASGTASISTSMLAGYAQLGVPMDDLLAASFMAVPGGLLYAKLIVPTPRDRARMEAMPPMGQSKEVRSANLADAIATGTLNGLRVAVYVGAMLIAFISVIALVNAAFGQAGLWLHAPGLSLDGLLGALLAPIVWLLGVPWHECPQIGAILGIKIVVNEFVAYSALSPSIHHATLSARSIAITSVALCGFANLSSIGVLIGAFGSQCPERRHDVARLGARAVLAGTLSNLTSAAIIGLVGICPGP